ncbi:MAG TPA: hypothetical protein VF710_08795 [Longimicrobium sp.]|jgi:hypothetical protein
MTLTEQLRKIAEEQASALPSDPEYHEMSEFLDEMIRLGIAKKQVYDLPRLDTIGRSLHRKRGRGQDQG